jgi:hypothetical protein
MRNTPSLDEFFRKGFREYWVGGGGGIIADDDDLLLAMLFVNEGDLRQTGETLDLIMFRVKFECNIVFILYEWIRIMVLWKKSKSKFWENHFFFSKTD